ncbi:MAG: Asp-tRNA(Asn)/Glu-tRNA(Gln) amidotransferase subunit GatB [Candidatus Thiodiazotropha sp. (ex Lucinoma aequizonata)]|nr:Asp-tRNA(Asn)/Glu-tRNA(Gln) amidotransferase subunit GatB [Candidatus Thiodiazotropha sp. (ex Lucinoma aequizonata)]MCU7889321.1 Asp-tRNA(Asn)/Glu-tRNA(Gln) amidotransferase subunit GatB [Candidatus Thiodiazotropha sp. (ex Lucinoma aequizonata)]MCU7894605.1 Asp-tRNA(Asn)/Glu-tRNA(Gln) amidotransferase subunit GatB [Candidatus Thiodiazotropha sp. (ex Lucinoma aequizonata)]MCU7898988.1 Asp-tRNA(Asn)/Glu-tRNA(Gln) amidotransferase subunit GatB [Candidatus Thiodiazotropha sp. (ex Lucinoma aequizo
MQWETVIGLEVHTQLATKSKIFSGASIAYGADPNTQACIIDLGFPGVLPVLNEAVVDMALIFGLAINVEIGHRSVFARKNYFYPDLPKGYQISQFELPIVGKGSLTIDLENGSQKVIGITRAHLEEDAGKSLHEDFHGMSGIDLNRTGTPLLEIVSEPDMRSLKEAVAYARKIHQLVVYLGICDGNMQEGSFRVDANLSIRPFGQDAFGTRTELKNLNSFRFMERALNFELERQIDLLEGGGKVVQETRLYDADRDETRSMRSKEEANDYRYFPDPDLLPVEINDQQLQRARQNIPELPDQKRQRFESDYSLSSADALMLTQSRQQADFFEEVVSSGGEAKMAANWVTVELTGALNKAGVPLSQSPVTPEQVGGLLERIADNTISSKLAKQVFEAMWNGEGDADKVIEAKGLKQITDSGQIEAIIDEIIANNPKQVEQFRAGKDKLLGFFVGEVMKQTQGKANPGQVNKILLGKLKG